jgi:dTDP-D-glucose 4,6-dehydratase
MHTEGLSDRPDRYNITSDDELDNLQLAQYIAKVMGKELKYEYQDSDTARPGHDKYYGLSGEKLKKLGWTPPVSFEESMKNVVEWQQANPEWLNIKI